MGRLVTVMPVLMFVCACAPPPVDSRSNRFPPDTGLGSGRDAGSFATRISVRSVIDGDTVILSATSDAKSPDGRNINGETIRLLGVDAPEIAHPPQQQDSDCWGDEAHESARELMQGEWVQLEFGTNNVRDTYDRLLAYVVLLDDGRVANEVLIESGDARSYEGFTHLYRSRYDALEKKARDRSLGLWTCP